MRTFEDFYDNITIEEKIIVDKLRSIVLETNPGFREKISYNVPYYFLHSRVCYIWPASVRPGPRSGVVLGFCRGQMLSDTNKTLLDTVGRKEIATITFHNPDEINRDTIREILMEAVFIDNLTTRTRK